MLHAEEQGARIFECEISKRLAKEVVHRSNLEECEFEMADVVDTEYVAADDMMINTMAADGPRKRKEGTKDDQKNQCKFVKY